ncbi:hypothetical protein ASG99_14720 [Bacillus sp. Soil768D1]|nr:hypothetical protein ASG99_14720 [Bacillus sp. Soil768D1]
MGIYKELLGKEENKFLIEYWDKNKENNEWVSNKENEVPEKANQILMYIAQEIEKDNIFLSQIDLENDLVESNLFSSLKGFHNTRAKTSTVKKMQQAKAENMLSFLSSKFDTLVCLKDDKISEPLKRIKDLAEKVVCKND